MAAKHTLRIDFDDATGDVSITHRTIVPVGGHDVSFAEPVTIDDPAGAKATLKALVDANREVMEKRASEMAIEHVAAVNGVARKGRKNLTLGGTMGPVGKTTAAKE